MLKNVTVTDHWQHRPALLASLGLVFVVATGQAVVWYWGLSGSRLAAFWAIGVTALLTGIIAQQRYNQNQLEIRLRESEAEKARLAASIAHLLSTQRAEIDRSIAQETATINAANQTKLRLFSLLSHDLRSPIASIIDSLTLLEHHSLSQAEFTMLAQQLSQSTQKLYKNLENLLAWSLTQLNEISTHPELINARELADDVVELSSHRASQKQINLTNSLPGSLHLLVDEHQYKMVLCNLIDNALKYTPAGGQVTIWGGTQASWATICVQDTGIGITPDRLAALFTQAVPSPGLHGERGMGLGLQLCSELVSRNGGHLSVSSQPDTGTIFQIKLPLS
ncbi:HAMP domain-containing sensor histidine kinase [Fibrella sp. ES10-3-2-2]|nr:hypothetical protein A6C57_12865 [Fibrella sp. ES10-3-2-2]